jgi:hypothetical protein
LIFENLKRIFPFRLGFVRGIGFAGRCLCELVSRFLQGFLGLFGLVFLWCFVFGLKLFGILFFLVEPVGV